ncbi:MAG: LUD domain-containing protein [Cyclobacteriaceae bacterium]|nr:LUD domain-containing protein [Cyclobacteriaceae bacterium]
MNSRKEILSRIQKNKPEAKAMPVGFTGMSSYTFNDFLQMLEKVGGRSVKLHEIGDLRTWLRQEFGKEDLVVYSEWGGYSGNHSLVDPVNVDQMQHIDIAILEGEFAVAENGAIWVEKFRHRAIPFITQHLLLVISQKAMVSTMHEAYELLKSWKAPGFGVFISGPSKTADIEQSLVYGAHGPRSLTIVFLDNL